MIANGLQVTTPDAASPYTCSSVTGYSPLAAIPTGVTFSALLEIGNDKEWSSCTHDGAGELTVVRINATLKSGTYAGGWIGAHLDGADRGILLQPAGSGIAHFI